MVSGNVNVNNIPVCQICQYASSLCLCTHSDTTVHTPHLQI
jgi:DTW domain-containing protein YfiP